MTELYPGAQVRVTFTCTDELTDVTADPTALAVSYGQPKDDPTVKTWPDDAEVVRDSVGVFYIDITCPDDGQWAARAVATGAIVASTEISWRVQPSRF